MSIFWWLFPKKKPKESFKDLIEEWESKPIRKLLFSNWDMKKFMRRVKHFRNMKLYPFSTFIEKLDIIITNNQFKSWYNIQKALNEMDKWNYPVYKKIAFIDDLNVINRFLTPDYITYNFLFQKTDLKKILHNVALARDSHSIREMYAQTVRKALVWFNWLASTLIQFVILIVLSQLIIFPLLMTEISDLKQVKLLDWLKVVDQIWLNLFSWMTYFQEDPYSLMWFIGVFFFITFVIFLSWIIGSLVKIFFLYQANNNIRPIDQISNEIAFCSILKKNIKMLEIWEWSWKFQYVNFSEFMLKWALEALWRNLVNERFVTDYSYLFQFYFQFWEMPKAKKLTLTDWFKNLLEDILISYKTSLSWSWNFSLGQVYEKLDKYVQTIWLKMFEKQYKKLMSVFVTIIMATMAVWVVINMAISMMQNDWMKQLIQWT